MSTLAFSSCYLVIIPTGARAAAHVDPRAGRGWRGHGGRRGIRRDRCAGGGAGAAGEPAPRAGRAVAAADLHGACRADPARRAEPAGAV
eukprot:scaffold61517_cov45-Phaeocystis_antarctica.AAC.2